MARIQSAAILLAAAIATTPALAAPGTYRELRVDPPSLQLEGPTARRLLLVTGVNDSGSPVDLTRASAFRSSDPGVATIDPQGFVRPVRDGRTELRVESHGLMQTIPVTVVGAERPRTFHFENDILPVLSKLGCNASGCHGKAEGQNGFKLSVFGFDPEADHAALTRESRGRRVFPAAPESSLILTKMTGHSPHGGGTRAGRDSEEYRTLRDWIAAGTPVGDPAAPRVVSVRLEPAERTLAMRGSQQLRVTAIYSDGREADVTSHARFQSNNDAIGKVDPDGRVTAGEVPGEVAVMAAYQGSVGVFRALIPRAGATPSDLAGLEPSPEEGRIDVAVLRKLKRLNIAPSEVCEDSEYLRRVYLDVIGTLPTPKEARKFLADDRLDRRARLVDDLLRRPEYADYWALKWADLLRVDREKLGHKRAFLYYRWLRDQFARATPIDRITHDVVTAEGPLDEVGPANFFKVATKPGEAAGSLAQVFLGVRIGCAECHHHPYDRWGQDDYAGMQAFFTPVGVRAGPRGEAVQAQGEAAATIARLGRKVGPKPLGAPTVTPESGTDARGALATWMTSPENPYFARNVANRYWAHFLGRGLVEPVDDVRDTNPPSNPELLDTLAAILVDNRYDLKMLIRAITASKTYQRTTRPNATNADDEQNDSRARLRRLDAEVLFDMVCQTTGVPEKFAGVPLGARAIQLWDSKVPHYFLRIFGRPERVTACECERITEPGVSQVLHLLNAPELQAKLSHDAGAIAGMTRRLTEDSALVDELYLTFYSRLPNAEERGTALAHLRRDPQRRREAAEDLAWSLMNTLEFLFNH